MRAIVVTKYGGPDVLEEQTVPRPIPGSDEVLIRAQAIGVNFADIRLREGRFHAGTPPPTIPGLDVAGEIASAGASVEGFHPGQRVAALVGGGAYAEFVVAPAILTWPIPEEIDTETAAAYPLVAITSFNLLRMAGRLAAGETVLIHAAAGGVGSTLVQLARLLGGGTLIGTVGDDAKVDLAMELGCDNVINYRRADFVEQVKTLTPEAGVDLVLDGVGGEVFDRSLDCLAPFGRIVVYGFASGTPALVDTGTLQASNRKVIGYSTTTLRRLRPDALRPAGDAVLEYLRKGAIRMIIGARFKLSETARAHQMVESRRSVGKVLLLP